MISFKKYGPLLIIVGVLCLALHFDLHHYLTLTSLKTHQKTIEFFIHNHKIGSIFLYSLAYVIIVAVSIPGASFMTIVSGFLFGQFVGTAIAVISATLGACILFISAGQASDGFDKSGGKWVQKMKDGFQENAFFYLLTLRLIPLFPFAAINLGAAFLRIPFSTFLYGTMLGIIPGSFVYVLAGVALRDVIEKPDVGIGVILDPGILMALGGLGMLSLLPVVYKWYQQRRISDGKS